MATIRAAENYTGLPTWELDPELLRQTRVHAAEDDAANVFFDRDFRALVDAGHLVCNLPVSLGGGGLDLRQTALRQRQLGRYAPAVALATSMHLYWVGAAATLDAFGINDLSLVLTAASEGEVLASGHAEAGNDLPGLMSTTTATPVGGGYRVTGRKLFGSLGPVWDRLGFHAMDTTDPEHPMVIHGFIRRNNPGVTVVPNWDTIAMRASQSHDTVLDDVFVSSDDIVAVVPAKSIDDLTTGAAFLWATTLIANVYVGIAERALELAVDAAANKISVALDHRTIAHNPMVQHQIADMWIALDGARSSADHFAHEWVSGADHGTNWGPKVFALKQLVTDAAASVTSTALDVVGGASIRSDAELSRLWRDVQASKFHPPTSAFAHETIAKAVLNIEPAARRW